MGRFHKFFRSVAGLPLIPLQPQQQVVAIPESTDVLCENCHHHVSISGFIPHLSGEFNECPRCHCKDQSKLKYTAAWLRTEEEQRIHWEGRKVRKGFVKAINGGVPKPLERETPLELEAGKKTA